MSGAVIATEATLTDAEVSAYRRDGQVTPRWHLSEDLLAAMRRSLDGLLTARPEVRPDFIAPAARALARTGWY